jgi:hypothetical protein
MSARVVIATVEGKTYEIPAMWLVGATRTFGALGAVRQWHDQAVMEAAFNAQKGA